MSEHERPKSLKQRSPEELQALLKELLIEEERLSPLEEQYPEIAALSSDKGLPADKYRIWQSIYALRLLGQRIDNVRQHIREKQGT